MWLLAYFLATPTTFATFPDVWTVGCEVFVVYYLAW